MFKSRSVAHWLWNHNPFYVISALLMLYGVQASYGELNIGTINCWRMMTVLGSYTVLLAIIGVLIVRWGKVWDDARSILLVLLLLFLSVSVSADDLFVKIESAKTGAFLMLGGFSFSVIVLLGVLFGAGIRLRLAYLVPLILFLALFYIAPWWCSPELHPTTALNMEWTLFMFPQISALLLLTLIPAVRMRENSVAGNGTPWPWPLFPWSAFVFIGIAVVIRSYALAMTFGQSGPIWALPDSRSGIVFDTVWRPFFLVPFALAILVLLLEAGLATGNSRLVNRALNTAPLLLVIAWPWGNSEATYRFLNSLTETVGSPLWLTVLMLIGFYIVAVLRRVENVAPQLLLSILLLSVVGPRTLAFESFTSMNPVPLFAGGTALAFLGIVRYSSKLTFAAGILLSLGCWAVLPTPQGAVICYHLMLSVCILIGLLWKDWFSKLLQFMSAGMIVLAVLVILNGQSAKSVPWEWRIGYALIAAVVAFFCARISRGGFYWACLVGTIGLLGEAFAVEGYRTLRDLLGRNTVFAFSWSVGTLLIGLLISAYKANWLPPLAIWGWFNSRPEVSNNLATAIPSVPDQPD